MSEATGEPGLSEEEAREYLRQLRSAPADQILADVLFSLLNTAQAKLGRRDARLLIDLSALVLDHVRDQVPGTLAQQVDEVLGQLRVAQVQAESDLARQGRTEENDLAQPPPSPPPQQQRPSKLWVPGQ